MMLQLKKIVRVEVARNVLAVDHVIVHFSDATAICRQWRGHVGGQHQQPLFDFALVGDESVSGICFSQLNASQAGFLHVSIILFIAHTMKFQSEYVVIAYHTYII